MALSGHAMQTHVKSSSGSESRDVASTSVLALEVELPVDGSPSELNEAAARADAGPCSQAHLLSHRPQVLHEVGSM